MFTYTCKDINGCNQYLKQIILHVFLRKTSHRLKGKVSSHAMKREKQHSSPVFYISKNSNWRCIIPCGTTFRNFSAFCIFLPSLHLRLSSWSLFFFFLGGGHFWLTVSATVTNLRGRLSRVELTNSHHHRQKRAPTTDTVLISNFCSSDCSQMCCYCSWDVLMHSLFLQPLCY